MAKVILYHEINRHTKYKLDVEPEEFFIDLSHYHHWLRCLLAIELKTTDFVPEYAAKMQFYMAVLDDRVKQKEELIKSTSRFATASMITRQL